MDGDGLQAALKHARDGVADRYGVADADPRITWIYDQVRTKPKDHWVRITVRPA